MSERYANYRASLGNADLMSQSTTSNAGDPERAVADLKKQILVLQSENCSLKRQIPRMKDMQGNDITENMKQLCDDLVKAEQSNEQWENKYAESEQNFSRFQRKMQNELDSRDTQIAQLKARAKALEEDNEKIKKEAQADQSKLYHLQNDADASEQHDLSLGAFEQSFEPDSVSQIKQELAEKVEENAKLSQQLNETMTVVENLKKTIEIQTDALKNLCMRETNEDDSLFALPKIGTDVDAAVANVLFILQQLNDEKHDQSKLQEEIIDLMRRHGYDVNAKSVAELSKDYENTFRTKFNNRRDDIKRTNDELAQEYRFDNSQLAQQLNQLSNDSVFSSTAAFGQQVSFALDPVKKTVGSEILNKTMDVAQDLGTVVTRMNGLRAICDQLFSKLQGTATFLHNLLNTLEDSDEGLELLRKINEIKFDLDKSMAEARDLVKEVKKAEKNVQEFHSILQQSIVNQTTDENSLYPHEVAQDITAAADVVDASKQEIERLKSLEVQCENLTISLNKELANKDVLNNNYMELKKQKNENESNFLREIEALHDKIGEQKEASLQLQKILEEKSQLLDGLMGEIKAKEDELVVANQKIQSLKGLLAESNESIGLVRSQLAESTNSYQAALSASSEQQKELEEKVNIIVHMEMELLALKNEKEGLIKQHQDTEVKLSSLRQESQVIAREKASLETLYKELCARYEEQQALVAEGNEMFYEKISNNPDESLEKTEGPEEDDVSDFDQFSKFLYDCSCRSNKLVQMVKNAEKSVTEEDSKIPYLRAMLNESRAVRLLLHKISKFFESQKKNFHSNNKELGRAIRDELKSIYGTLQTAANTSHSKMAAIKGDSAVGTQPK